MIAILGADVTHGTTILLLSEQLNPRPNVAAIIHAHVHYQRAASPPAPRAPTSPQSFKAGFEKGVS